MILRGPGTNGASSDFRGNSGKHKILNMMRSFHINFNEK